MCFCNVFDDFAEEIRVSRFFESNRAGNGIKGTRSVNILFSITGSFPFSVSMVVDTERETGKIFRMLFILYAPEANKTRYRRACTGKHLRA